jgi:hypothetical protein
VECCTHTPVRLGAWLSVIDLETTRRVMKVECALRALEPVVLSESAVEMAPRDISCCMATGQSFSDVSKEHFTSIFKGVHL